MTISEELAQALSQYAALALHIEELKLKLSQEDGMKVLLVNESGYTDREMKIFVDGLAKHGAKVAKEYGLSAPVVTTANFTGDASKSDLFDKSVAKIYITTRKPYANLTSAQAWRWVENGVPVVYAPPQRKPYGVYTKPWVLGGVVKTPARMRSGLVSVLAHELSEMIVSPLMDNFTLPDGAGKSWRKEVCDPVLGAYFMENINGQDCVFPDFVLPSFWDANGQAPYSYMGSTVGPMIWKKGTYAWFKSAVVRLLRVQF